MTKPSKDILRRGKINVMIDGQFGSTGKGALAAYIGHHYNIDLAISNASPNAGHSFDLNDGKGTRVCTHLPVSGVLNPNAQIYICAGAIIDPIILKREMEKFQCRERVLIHPRAVIVTDEHTRLEQDKNAGTTKLASTQKGVGAALAGKIMRQGNTVLARDYFPQKMISIVPVHEYIDKKAMLFMEVPQGLGLSINHGYSFPHCTSRDVTVAAALNDAGCHPNDLGAVIASFRSFPIRVGHIYDEKNQIIGHSGPFWPDSQETTFESFNLPPEYTTVTKRKRRIATFSHAQYGYALHTLRPDTVFINFMNYFETDKEAQSFVKQLVQTEKQYGIYPQKLYGYGPSLSDIQSTPEFASL